jgi:hypothetical protein
MENKLLLFFLCVRFIYRVNIPVNIRSKIKLDWISVNFERPSVTFQCSTTKFYNIA